MGVSLLRSEVFVPRRFFGRLREVVVADRGLVEVFRFAYLWFLFGCLLLLFLQEKPIWKNIEGSLFQM